MHLAAVELRSMAYLPCAHPPIGRMINSSVVGAGSRVGQGRIQGVGEDPMQLQRDRQTTDKQRGRQTDRAYESRRLAELGTDTGTGIGKGTFLGVGVAGTVGVDSMSDGSSSSGSSSDSSGSGSDSSGGGSSGSDSSSGNGIGSGTGSSSSSSGIGSGSMSDRSTLFNRIHQGIGELS